MFNLRQITQDLKQDEGFRSKPYRDIVGKLTIGYGHNLDDKGILEHQADMILADDIAEICGQLDQYLPWWRKMSDIRQGVLLNMCFNLGIKSLLTFKNTLEAMKNGDYEQAARGMENSKWFGQVKERAVRLVKEMRNG